LCRVLLEADVSGPPTAETGHGEEEAPPDP
jgi:hypothetical protein